MLAAVILAGCAAQEPVGRFAGPARTTPPAPLTQPAPTEATAQPAASPTPRKIWPHWDSAGPGGSSASTGLPGIALTFDDGPDPAVTPRLLDLLGAHGVKATFCLTGFRAKAHPAIVQRIAAEGHTLCSHSWQHLGDLARRDVAYQRWDLTSTNDAIRAAVPDAAIKYFRAPYGWFTPELVGLARELGMRSIYWNADDRAYNDHLYGRGQRMLEYMQNEVHRDAKPGAIVLSHDLDRPHVIRAYQLLLPWLTSRFTLVALPAEDRPRRVPGGREI